ncbi:MAG: YIP1 family protein [Pseudomonadota bacterium]
MLAPVLNLMKLSILNPKEGSSTILSFSPGRDVLWSLLLLTAVVSGILSTISAWLLPPPTDISTQVLLSPLLFTAILTGVMLLTVICTHYIGRGFGGTGQFNESLLIVTWLQLILIAVQVLQIALMLFSPGLAQLLGMVSVALFIWLYVNFVATLHGFSSIPFVLVGMIVSMIAVAFGLSLALGLVAALLGLELPGV